MSNSILEQTGYSYSGISDIINNQPELRGRLLDEMDNSYLFLTKEIQKAEAKLNSLKTHLGYVVSSFIHYHKSLHNKGEINRNELAYHTNKEVVVIRIDHDANTIKHERFERIKQQEESHD